MTSCDRSGAGPLSRAGRAVASLAAAALLGGCNGEGPPCGGWADITVTLEGGAPEGPALVAEGLARYEEWSGQPTVCVDEIRLVDEVEKPNESQPTGFTVGYYTVESRTILLSGWRTDLLPMVLRHELCHAFEYAGDLAEKGAPAFSTTNNPGLASQVRTAPEDAEREIFALACEEEPISAMEAAWHATCGGADQRSPAVQRAHELVTGPPQFPMESDPRELQRRFVGVDVPYELRDSQSDDLWFDGGIWAGGGFAALLINQDTPLPATRVLVWDSAGRDVADVEIPRAPDQPRPSLAPGATLPLIRTEQQGQLWELRPGAWIPELVQYDWPRVLRAEAAGWALGYEADSAASWLLLDLASGETVAAPSPLRPDEQVIAARAGAGVFELSTNQRLLLFNPATGATESWPGRAASDGAGLGFLPNGGRLGIMKPFPTAPNSMIVSLPEPGKTLLTSVPCLGPGLATVRRSLGGSPALMGYYWLSQGYGANVLSMQDPP